MVALCLTSIGSDWDADWCVCRAHLNEAPEQPALLLAGAELLDPDCVVEDPFIAFQGTASLMEYWKHLRSQGAAFCPELYPQHSPGMHHAEIYRALVLCDSWRP